MAAIHRFIDGIARLVRLVVLIQASAIFAIIIFTVISRYGFSWVLSWSEEVPRYLLIWMSFLSAAAGVDISDHIAFDYFYDRVPPRVRKLLQLLINAGIVGLGFIVCYYGIQFVADFGEDNMESIPFTNVWYYTAMPVSGFLIMLFAVRNQLGVWFGNEGRAPRPRFDDIGGGALAP
ncbi:MAG: TRAP transporter small permease [Gammaproteobacteria bacterium]